MKVSDVMSRKVDAVLPQTKLRELWKLIFKHQNYAIPVVDTQKKLLGIVAESDLLKPLYPDYSDFVEDFVSASDFEQMEDRIHDLVDLTAEKLMQTHVIFTRGDTPIMRALSRMILRRVSQLPVVTQDDTVVGIITKGDIFAALLRSGFSRKNHKKTKK